MNIENFEKRKLSNSQAEKIADAMYDLGEKDKLIVIMALSGVDTNRRLEAYNLLDEISQLIVKNILIEDSIGEAKTNMSYLIKCFTNIQQALDNINSEK